MLNPTPFTLLNGVKPYRTNWRVHVKLLNCWKQNTSFGECKDFIILQKESDFLCSTRLPIGVWRSIENFTVSGAKGKYRPTVHQYKLTFTGDTVIIETDFHSDSQFRSLCEKLFPNSSLHMLLDKLLIYAEYKLLKLWGKTRRRRKFNFVYVTAGEIQNTNSFDVSLVAIDPMLEEAINLKQM
ncbi:hypothetical protein N665_0339s0025 [Sinapis alba]|nr:hypothetical protein N665_0339s0025 [Sinapis alba]